MTRKYYDVCVCVCVRACTYKITYNYTRIFINKK